MKLPIHITMLLLAAILSLPAAAQSFTVTGKVTDCEGRPLAAAAVSASGTRKWSVCDSEGRYSLSLGRGQYTLTVSLLGYADEERRISLTSDITADFTLEEDAVSVGTVSILGKSEVRKIAESAYSVTALDVKTVTSSVSNLNDLVNRSSGVQIREEGGAGSDFDLSINGLSGNSVRYFIDGVPLDAKGADVRLNNLPVNFVDRIEIYKGVVPAHLGTDALGGAINIVTSRRKNNWLDISYGLGSFHTHAGDLNAQIVEPRTGILFRPTFGANYSKNDYLMRDVEVWDEEQRKYVAADRRRFHDDYLSLFGQLEAGVNDRKWADEFFVSGSYSHVDKELQTGAMQNKVYGAAARQSRAWSVAARYSKRWGKVHTHLSVSHTGDRSRTIDTAYRIYSWDGTYTPSSRNEINGRGRSIRIYDRPLTIARANIGYDIAANHNIGFNWMLNRTGNGRSDEVDASFEPTHDALTKMIAGLNYNQRFFDGRMENAFFVKDYINIAEVEQKDQSSVTGSDKVAAYSARSYIGGGAASRFVIFEPLALKISYEHSVRLPLARELLGNGTTIYPNLRLRPETSENINFGIYGTARLGSEHLLSYEAEGFMRYVHNFIQASVSEKEGTMQYDNIPAIHIKGANFEARYQWRNSLQAEFNISYNDARDRRRYKTDGKPSATYMNRVPNRPWFYCNAALSYTFDNLIWRGDALRLEYDWRWVHWFYLSWEAYGSKQSKSRIPGQNVSNASVTYSLQNRRYSISFECSNLFDAKVYDNYMLQKPGRAFFAKLRVFIK